jgi:hypothetical protein
MINLLIDGSATLEQIRFTCGTTENLEFCKLVHMDKRPVVNNNKKNLATFTEVDPAGDIPPDLVFVALAPGQSAASVIATQLQAGKLLIFDEHIFVQNNDTEVLAFR